ncbi:MAG TPA: transcriptional regulator [Firmicutes bacterium]|jgi:hypothetical protein|nr:MAG: transcriptional regulator [Peptococcaceae bacterium 1109]HHT72220.1 transcriptional regulator [Bacillota bacterium]
MAPPHDFKKAEKHLYQPKTDPVIIDVPEMLFIAVDGVGDPNTSPEYEKAVQVLYGLSYTIKMSHKSGDAPQGYFDYVVPPLEGLWWGGSIDLETMTITDKSTFSWTMLIRQPEFVTDEVFAWAQEALAKKKRELDPSTARLWRYREGLCVQVLHIGPYDTEPESIRKMNEFIAKEGFRADMSPARRHHEIYLSDPRKTAPEKLKTVVRHPIAKL